MKKADLMLTFLFWGILGLVIFIPSILWASQFLKLSNKALESYNKLGELINLVKDGETLSMGYYMDKKSIIVGFSRDSNRFENHEYRYGIDRKIPDQIDFVLNRPNECKNQKACICLCCNIKIEQKTKPYTAICNKCGKEPACKSFDNIDILSEKIVRRYGNGKPQNSWKGGFLHLRDVPVAVVVNGLGQNEVGTRTFYVQRYKNIVDVCLNSPCIIDELKEQIDSKETNKPFDSSEPLI